MQRKATDVTSNLTYHPYNIFRVVMTFHKVPPVNDVFLETIKILSITINEFRAALHKYDVSVLKF